jgi:hypothetical protein
MTTSLRIILALIIILAASITLAQADDNDASESGEAQLSPYWGSAISQWDWWIRYWAQDRELDPDLVAAVVRKESIGRCDAEGPYGAVGLMMVMSNQDSGLWWRPTREELKEPDINIRWGTGILKEIIRKTDGNLALALAAYNGGWEQLNLASTARYAHSVLNFYAYAIAAHHGYTYQEGKIWTMVIVTQVDGRATFIQTDSSGHFLAPCFDDLRQFQAAYPEVGHAPRTRVTHYVDGDGNDVFIDAWLFVGGLDRHIGNMLSGTDQPINSSLAVTPE